MRCEYCGVEVTDYPASGLCGSCGAKLPPKPVSEPQPVQPAQPILQPVYIPVQPQYAYAPQALCPKCHSPQVVPTKRGFSWGWGLFGFFMIPGFGLLLGFCGSKKPRMKCLSCSHKWKPY